MQRRGRIAPPSERISATHASSVSQISDAPVAPLPNGYVGSRFGWRFFAPFVEQKKLFSIKSRESVRYSSEACLSGFQFPSSFQLRVPRNCQVPPDQSLSEFY